MASEQGETKRTREETMNLQERIGLDEVRRWNSGQFRALDWLRSE